MSFSDADAQRMLRIIDERIAHAMAQSQVRYEWGVVESVDTTANTCSVFLFADSTSSAGFKSMMQLPETGAVVRVAIDPRGDRYIDKIAGPGYVKVNRAVGGSYLLGQVTGDNEKGRIRLATDGSGLPTMYLGNGTEAVGAESVQVARNASGELAFLTNSTTNAIRINDKPLRYVQMDTTGSGTFFIPDNGIGRSGGCLLTSFGNDGVGIMGWYRNSSFNYVSGLWSGPGSVGFQGTTFSPGAHTWSWYIESNVAGARLAIRSTAGFSRSFGLWVTG